MPKERKTKSQKIAAETRHYLYHFEERSPLPKKVESPTIAQPTLQSFLKGGEFKWRKCIVLSAELKETIQMHKELP
ncbi:MAG: hypothetical protein US77_C0013G0008 [Microgenomates group bacterium GW2011_GWC1_38_14]|nr:MAG: hypothetical protein US77_C0013G0008 [Microgenomates group bacterium GW2011_GWC1_38_14]